MYTATKKAERKRKKKYKNKNTVVGKCYVGPSLPHLHGLDWISDRYTSPFDFSLSFG